MSNELPTLKSTNKELESIYDTHSKRFFHWLETNSISANSSRDIALLAHNELVKRSNNKFSNLSKVLTIAVLILSLITVTFAFYDYSGDKEWQKKQITELEKLNVNLIKRNSEINELKFKLENAETRIKKLESQLESE